MAAVPSEIVPAGLELRSAALSLIAVVLKSSDLDVLTVDLEQRARLAPGLFDDEPVAIDLSCVASVADAIDFPALLALLRRHRMMPLAARGGSFEQMAAARAAGLVEAPEGRPARDTLFAPPVLVETVLERIVEQTIEVQLAPLPPLIIERPLRSGQQVHAQGRDLIVLALVSYGAEVSADGHGHVYAPLRGRAMAGFSGNTGARIFATTMEPQLLSIAGVVRTTDVPLPDGVAGRVAMAQLVAGELQVRALTQRV